MEGVGSSTAGFIGMAHRGETIGKPRLVHGVDEFHKYFGEYLGKEYGEHRFLSHAVEQFFENGGIACYVMRVAPNSQVSASVDVDEALHVTATSSGTWGNTIQVRIRKSYQTKTFITRQATDNEIQNNQYRVDSSSDFYPGDIVEISEKLYTITSVYNNILEFSEPLDEDDLKDTSQSQVLQSVVVDIQIICENFGESFEKCSLNRNSPNFIEAILRKSDFVNICLLGNDIDVKTFYTRYTSDFRSYVLTGGTSMMADNDYQNMYIGQDNGVSQRSGIQAFLEIHDVSMMAVPGITLPSVQKALITHCESTANRFAILDAPLESISIDKLYEHRNQFDTSYAALYYPWLSHFDPLLGNDCYTPPSGAIAGVYARVDNSMGIWKVPANEVVKNVTGLSIHNCAAEHAILNQKGINLIRSIPGVGIRVWGARTCSDDGTWKYIHVRRLIIYIEQSIKENIKRVVGERNDEHLWSELSNDIFAFLTILWRNGALAGSSSDEAFYVNIGRTTMSQDDILNGRLICDIGVAAVRPAEFITFRITQNMEEVN